MGFITTEGTLNGYWRETKVSFFKTKSIKMEEQKLLEKEEQAYMLARYNYKKYIPMKPNSVCKSGSIERLCYACGQPVGENYDIRDFCAHCGQRTDYL